MSYSILKTPFDLVQKQESYEFFPEVGSVKTSSYRNPAYDHFHEKRIAPRESAWKTEQYMWKSAKSTDPCSAPLPYDFDFSWHPLLKITILTSLEETKKILLATSLSVQTSNSFTKNCWNLVMCCFFTWKYETFKRIIGFKKHINLKRKFKLLNEFRTRC